jgi:uncharacterized protein YbbC (DUF1343 family)
MIYFKPFKSTYLFLFLLLNFQLISCAQSSELKVKILKIETGAARTNLYLRLLEGKNIAVVANQTSVILKNTISKTLQTTHLIDSLVSLQVNEHNNNS